MKKPSSNQLAIIVTPLLTAIVTAATTAFLTAYFVNNEWSKNFERYKNKISFEKEAATYGFELSKELFLKAAKVYKNAAQYRGVDLLPGIKSAAQRARLKQSWEQDQQYPKITSQEIFRQHNEFQIQLIASAPYITSDLFKKLSHFSTTGAKVIFNMEPNKDQLALYAEFAKSYDESIKIFRLTYNLTDVESSVLMLKQ